MNEAVFSQYKKDAQKNIKKVMDIVSGISDEGTYPHTHVGRQVEVAAALTGSIVAGLFSISDALQQQTAVATSGDSTGESTDLHRELSSLVQLIGDDDASPEALDQRAATLTNMFGLNNVKSIDWESPFFSPAAEATEQQCGSAIDPLWEDVTITSALDEPEEDGPEYEDDADPTEP